MTTTMGQLVSRLMDKYERRYHDEHKAAIAVQAELERILTDRETPVSSRVRTLVE